MKKKLYMLAFVAYVAVSFLSVFHINVASAELGEAITPIALFDFNQVEGTTIYDVSGNGHNGTVYFKTNEDAWETAVEREPVLKAGKYGTAMDFSNGYYADFPVDIVAQLDEDFTIAFWVCETGINADYTRIMDMSNDCDNNDKFGENLGPWSEVHYITTSEPKSSNIMLNMWRNDVNANFERSVFGVETVTIDQTETILKRNEWVHIAYSVKKYNANASEVTFYCNGEKVAVKGIWQQPNGVGTVYATIVPGQSVARGPNWSGKEISRLRMGLGEFDWDSTFRGMLDDVAFYDKGLTASQIEALYNADIMPGAKRIVADYSLDGNDVTDTPATDNKTKKGCKSSATLSMVFLLPAALIIAKFKVSE